MTLRASDRPCTRPSALRGNQCEILHFLAKVGACELILHIHVLINWQGICWLISHDRIAGSGLPIEVAVFLKLSADKLLVCNKSQAQLQVDFYANLLFEVNYELTNESFVSSLGQIYMLKITYGLTPIPVVVLPWAAWAWDSVTIVISYIVTCVLIVVSVATLPPTSPRADGTRPTRPGVERAVICISTRTYNEISARMRQWYYSKCHNRSKEKMNSVVSTIEEPFIGLKFSPEAF